MDDVMGIIFFLFFWVSVCFFAVSTLGFFLPAALDVWGIGFDGFITGGCK